MDDDKVVEAVMLDLSKAFDTGSLHHKMAYHGVVARELKWFEHYLARRKQRVCLGETRSACSDILRGGGGGSHKDQSWVLRISHSM